MDPISQAALGSVAAVALSRGSNLRVAALVGAAAGAAPDLDVLIRSAEDPLLALQYHRHFTHALIFAPIIGLIVAGLFKLIFFRKEPSLRELAIFAIAGALTHGALDACTSYGTLLYWPFSSHRESWDIISIIDPLFTGPLLLLLLVALIFRKPTGARCAVVWCLFYFAFGVVQRERAEDYVRELAASRSHEPTELTARPSLGNLLLWRVIYRGGSNYYVDAVWLGLSGEVRSYAGSVVRAFEVDDFIVSIREESRLAYDIRRFDHFSQGYLYEHIEDTRVLGDLRYAIFPDSVTPLWGIRIDPAEPEKPVELEYFRRVESGAFQRLWTMIQGQPLEE